MPTDPLHQLARPSAPARPNPSFAIALWRRIEEELGVTSPELLTMRDLTTGQVGIIHIRFPDADRAFRFYGQLLDWESEPYRDEGFTAHYVTNTELLTVLTDDPTAPLARLWFSVTDLPAATALVTQLGGAVEDSQMTDDAGWARVTDGQGTPLGLWRRRGEHPTAPSPIRPKGEVGYVTLHVADSGRAVAFYERLLGWRFQVTSIRRLQPRGQPPPVARPVRQPQPTVRPVVHPGVGYRIPRAPSCRTRRASRSRKRVTLRAERDLH